MKTNKEHLVEMSVQAKIHAPTSRGGYRVDNLGVPRVLPGVGGIVYNYRIGDCCMLLAGDHIEPGVSLRNEDKAENEAVMHNACVGNRAIVVDGDAKGAEGFVTGKHGGIEHTLCYFDSETLDKLKIGDQILIRAKGRSSEEMRRTVAMVWSICSLTEATLSTSAPCSGCMRPPSQDTSMRMPVSCWPSSSCSSRAMRARSSSR